MDWKNKGDFSDRNTVIYGHHMKNGSMFAALVEYKDPDYFNAHRTIYLYTPQGVYTATVFSAYVDVATGPQTTISLQDDAAFLSFVETMRNQSITKTDTPIGAEDRIITLSTCTYEYDDARFIVQAVLHPVKTTGNKGRNQTAAQWAAVVLLGDKEFQCNGNVAFPQCLFEFRLGDVVDLSQPSKVPGVCIVIDAKGVSLV